jgi:peptidoglycan/xylan/chitin deacetylase (PgdA/CDA1 family)
MQRYQSWSKIWRPLMAGSAFWVTTSWDDGYPADRRVAELLAKYGVGGTFYVPNRNIEGREVMSEADLLALSQGFEIGGHTRDHVVLTRLSAGQIADQVNSNKAWIEDLIGQRVRGFCYVRGRYNPLVKLIVKESGFDYARTVKNFACELSGDLWEYPTTIQFFPHSRNVYMRNFLKGEKKPASVRLLVAAVTSRRLSARICSLVRLSADLGDYFHLWGHSWEVEALNLWSELEDVLKLLADLAPAGPSTNENAILSNP